MTRRLLVALAIVLSVGTSVSTPPGPPLSRRAAVVAALTTLNGPATLGQVTLPNGEGTRLVLSLGPGPYSLSAIEVRYQGQTLVLSAADVWQALGGGGPVVTAIRKE